MQKPVLDCKGIIIIFGSGEEFLNGMGTKKTVRPEA